MKISRLHHAAYRCQDSEATRAFYEDFLGLPLAEALEISVTKTGNAAKVLHTFYEMEDGSYIAFFEAPEKPFDFKEQHDFDVHIALEASEEITTRLYNQAKAEDREVRGPVDHGMVDSIYFRDPNGYTVELVNKKPNHDALMDPTQNSAREKLDNWQRSK